MKSAARRTVLTLFLLGLSTLLQFAFFIADGRAQGVITTVAGADRVFRGNGGPATEASLETPQGLAMDAASNLYLSDAGHDLVLKVSPSGILTILAGNGFRSFSGEGGPATSASLNNPNNVVCDSAGNIYVADTGNHRVRRISADGTIVTVAGNGAAGFSGDGGPATAAALNTPFALVIDGSGTLYIGDTMNNRVRRVSPGGTISTIAGNGTAGFSGDAGPAVNASLWFPRGLALDSAANLYIADTVNNRIRKVTAGIITTVAGNGNAGFGGDGVPATEASLSGPQGVALDGAGNLYIADTENDRIRRVVPAGTIQTLAGGAGRGFAGDGGPATGARLFEPATVLVDSANNVYFADKFNDRVRKVAPNGTITTIVGRGFVGSVGDGGPATSAALYFISSIVQDLPGNLFIGDAQRHRIRKVTRDGIITTVAGNGLWGFSGDGGPATDASLAEPFGVATDQAGNVFIADRRNHRIRKVTPGGIITTIAGNGQQGFSGDGGPATSASLNTPHGVGVDRLGNVYIADTQNSRIRKVSPLGVISTLSGGGPNSPISFPMGLALDSAGNLYVADFVPSVVRKIAVDGTISTVAGNFIAGFSGDGGPAVSASLNLPVGVALDAAGDVYISDTFNHRIRAVSRDGVIRTIAGNGISVFAGDGGPATAASLSIPFASTVGPAGNVLLADSGHFRIREILATAPTLAVTPAALSFTVPSGTAAGSSQEITISSSLAGLLWSAQASTESGGNWLLITPPVGSAPGTISVRVDPANLLPGTYRGQVTVSALGAAPPTRTVTVQAIVEPGPAARLLLEPTALTFEANLGTASVGSQTLRIGNAGSGSLAWTASVETANGGNWLGISQSSGNASASAPSGIQITASIANLAAGVYSSSVRVRNPATSQEQVAPVTLVVKAPNQTIALSSSGLRFRAVEGSTAVPSQGVFVLNTGQGAMDWTAEVTAPSGANWLRVVTGSGRSEAGTTRPPSIEVAPNASGLRAGIYSGLVRVRAAGADNSPQVFSVHLNVQPAGSATSVLVYPTNLIFAARVGESSPSSQRLGLGTAAPAGVKVRAFVNTSSGGAWLHLLPNEVNVTPAEPGTITVQPLLGNLVAGTYRGVITLQFSDNSPSQFVDVTFLVLSAAAASPAAVGTDGRNGSKTAAVACEPRRMQAALRTQGSSFVSPVNWPTTLEAQVVDDCGQAVTSATVLASFSNGDPSLRLNSVNNGLYVGTWRPVNPVQQVLVTVRASRPPLAEATVQAQGRIQDDPLGMAINSGGVVNASSFAPGQPLAPGSIISVFGRNMARGVNAATQFPLPSRLGGAALSIGGVDVPLFFTANGQINAQVPFELAPNSRPQVLLRVQGESGTDLVAVPETITLAAARPAVFTTNQQGTGQGAILDGQGRVVDVSAPARAGDVVQVFCTGLGATEPAVATGRPAPAAEPLARVSVRVEARVGGQTARVLFAGLAPNFVGLYQVNVEIPQGVQAGPAVPLVLIQDSVSSSPVTLAIQ